MARSTMACRWAWLASLVLAGFGTAQLWGQQPEQPAAPPAPLRPDLLTRPVESPPAAAEPGAEKPGELLKNPFLPPIGYTGPSSIQPRDQQENSDFVPVEDRWRAGFPAWDRYGKGHEACDEDYPYQPGHWYDPYNQNVLKGDYPIIGQHTFLNVTVTYFGDFLEQQVPIATTPFESTTHPLQEEFFGRPTLFSPQNFFRVNLDLFHGDGAFKPTDWRISVTPVFNVNTLDAQELAVVNPNVLKGTSRDRSFFSLEEWFVETKLTDLSPNYDFVSARVGSQFFNNDFRGFLFSDTNRAVRIFGTRLANQDQFNIIYFRQQEKDTDSGLNTFNDRQQDIVMANYYHQDFIWPGYTVEASVAYNYDHATFHFDNNGFLVRPDPVGTFQPHHLDVVYLGLASDGHINRFNVTTQFYWALGQDSDNPLANMPQSINAQFFAAEVSYDRDWARFRGSFMFASGDSNLNSKTATGFDSIMDDPNFAGGKFSYWQNQAIKLFGVNLVQQNSLLPDLRSSKIQGQSNFVNPGLWLANFGVDFDITPKLRMINNINLLWFDETAVLQQFTFQDNIHRFIGTDISSGFEYRPLLNNNVILSFGVSMLIPGQGFRDLYNQFVDNVDPMLAGFADVTLQY